MSNPQTTGSAILRGQKLKAEKEQEHCVKTFLQAYLDFPTPQNLDAVMNTMRIYQLYWMDGRTR